MSNSAVAIAHNLRAVAPEQAERDAQNPQHYRPSEIHPEAADAPQPHPELGGKRLRLPGDAAIYLVDPEGYRHWIPDPYTYNRVFRDWNGIYDDADLNEIPDGGQLSYGTSVIRADGTAPVYLVSNGHKRWIVNPTVMDKCNFKWPDGGDVVGPAVVDSIPNGNDWNV